MLASGRWKNEWPWCSLIEAWCSSSECWLLLTCRSWTLTKSSPVRSNVRPAQTNTTLPLHFSLPFSLTTPLIAQPESLSPASHSVRTSPSIHYPPTLTPATRLISFSSSHTIISLPYHSTTLSPHLNHHHPYLHVTNFPFDSPPTHTLRLHSRTLITESQSLFSISTTLTNYQYTHIRPISQQIRELFPAHHIPITSPVQEPVTPTNPHFIISSTHLYSSNH